MSIATNIPAFDKLQRQSSNSSQPQHRRSSTCIITTNDANNVLPNYLRASIGSCHDFCKFGLKPNLNMTVERNSSFKGSAAAPASRKRVGMAKDDTFLQPKKGSLSRDQSVKIMDKKAPISPRPSVELKKKPQMRSKEEPNISTPKKVRQRDIEISKPKDTSSGTGLKSAIKTGKGSGTLKTSKETENGVKVQKPVLNLNGKKKVNSPSATQSPTRSSEVKAAPKRFGFLKSKKERMQPPNDHEDVPEKIIHVIEMTTHYSEGKEKKVSSLVHSPEAQQNMRTLFVSPNAREEKDQESQSPRKLKFKKGRETDAQNEGNDEGNKIKFRQSELLELDGNRQNLETVRLKITENLETGNDQSNETTKEVDEVVLRAQHPIEKEQSESLYNDVIKETARKLVKTKKSKVKALVNAFETIISLQDDKSQVKVNA